MHQFDAEARIPILKKKIDNIRSEARLWVIVGAKKLSEIMPGE